MAKKRSDSIKNLPKALEMRRAGADFEDIIAATGMNINTLKRHFHLNGIKLTEEKKKERTSRRWKDHSPITADGQMTCSECEKLLPLDRFTVNANTASGLSYKCIGCQSDRYLANSDVIKARVKDYRDRNKEKIRDRDRAYYEAHKQRFMDKSRDWAVRHPERRAEISRGYRRKHRLKIRAKDAALRASRRQALPPWLSSEQKLAIRNIYRDCPEGYRVDHIIPLTGECVSGLHVPWNLQYLTAYQNESKGNALVLEKYPVGTCFQKTQRDRYLAEDTSSGAPIHAKAAEFTLALEEYLPEHREFIERYEWLGTWGMGIKWIFTARLNGRLGAVVSLGEPNAYSGRYSSYNRTQIQRGAAASWSPKNLNSRLLSFAVRHVAKHHDVQIFIGYSDPTAGEIGTIYQATNFMFLGFSFGSKMQYRLPGGKLVGRQYFLNTIAFRRHAKTLGIEWKREWLNEKGRKDVTAMPSEILIRIKGQARAEWNQLERVNVPPKGKYVLIVGKNPRETVMLRKEIGLKGLPYPKREEMPLDADENKS